MVMPDDSDLQRMVELHEGYRTLPYDDATGKVFEKGMTLQGNLTIGIGCNLSAGLRENEIHFIFRNRLQEAITDLQTFGWWSKLDDVRQRALIDLRFQLGPTRFREFTHMLSALSRGDFGQAAKQIMLSRYATQVPVRARSISYMIEHGGGTISI